MGIALAVAAATAAVYAGVRHHGFLTYDDRGYLFENHFVAHGMTPIGVAWAFRTFYFDNWHPLTWLSHMLDCQVFGLAPGPHHVMNVAWHVANAVVLLLLLDRMTGARWRSALVAALFALHPLHVESVAWVSERKDLLSTFFGLICIWYYANWSRQDVRSAYALSVAAYALSLMSKPMLVTLPFVLMLLDFWPLGRAASMPVRRLISEKLPLFVLSLASSTLTYHVQQVGGAVVSNDEAPIGLRLANAVIAYTDYLWMMVWPVHLAVLYPYPERIDMVRLAASAAVLLAITALALRFARRLPVVAVGWLWYLGTLVPVIGLVQAGLQAKADRYTYFPSIGIFLILAWSLPSLRAIPRLRAVAIGAAVAAALIAVAYRAHVQVGYWRDTVTLFDRTLAVTRSNYGAHEAKGYALETERHWVDEAIAEYREALRINPNFHSARRRLADALLQKGAVAEAVEAYRALTPLAGEQIHDRHNLAVALMRLGRPAEAIPHLEEVIRLRPRSREGYVGLGLALEQAGRLADAIRAYERGVAQRPRDAELHAKLGAALANQGRKTEAAARLREALRLQPTLEAARESLEPLEQP